MDAESETMVQTALSALLKGRTVIVIAHRMRTIANADKIVVLDKGKVTEVGTPSELAKKAGCMRIWLHSSRNSKCLPYRHERPKREI